LKIILNNFHLFYLAPSSPSSACAPCDRKFEENGIRPTIETFNKYIPFFLSDLPDENCAKAGRAAYSAGMNYISESVNNHFVKDSYFMSYHTTVITSEEFYSSLKKAREISDNIEEMFREKGKDLKVFPYSIFYVFYEQYLTIWGDALGSLGLSLAAVFVVTFIVTGSFSMKNLKVF
jgi:Niemann-Pick C1 protein